MLFSSISFLYYFVPAVIGIYFLVPKVMKNLVLLLASMFFYFWGEPVYSVLMLVSIMSGYLHGLWIEREKTRGRGRIPLASSIIVSIGMLIFFKYTDFFIENINLFTHAKIPLLRIALPIGISFYTFQTLSYTIDVYRGQAKVQKNILNFAAYVSLFPQLIAGPIVRYTTVEAELDARTHSFENFSYGVNRFVIGLAKKVLLANTLGELVRTLTGTPQKSVLLYWVLALAFTLQIYFDFSGYSDMAIGLGRIFGFHFLENFNYPFISKSISEFWRRWHISLGTWFKDYVYIPMGGNRVGRLKWLRNTVVVWFLTGFWHGAEWNFIIWGLYFAVFLTLEKLLLKGLLERMPSVIRRLYMLFFIIISFVIFNDSANLSFVESLKGMFGLSGIPLTSAETLYYLKSYGLIMLLAAIGATPLVSRLMTKLKGIVLGRKIINILEPIAHVLLLLIITGYLVDGSFNPFLYFRF
jgi:alginate O-acetyltransferase complex protein AlgI